MQILGNLGGILFSALPFCTDPLGGLEAAEVWDFLPGSVVANLYISVPSKKAFQMAAY